MQSPNGGAESPEGDGRYACPAGAYFCSCKSRQNTLGAAPQDPLTLKLRLDTNDVNIVRTAPQIRSQGACGAFYFRFCRDRIKNQPYQRRLIPLREAVALAFRAGQKGSPQGRKTVWGEEDAPQRGGLPKVKHRVSPTQAEVASDERTGL